MTCQATGCTSSGTTLTLGANATGGTLVVGMTVTFAAQTQPVSPIVKLTSLASGGGSTSGSVWNTSAAPGISGSATVTFTLAEAPIGIMDPLPNVTQASQKPTTVPAAYSAIPPLPLPRTTTGTTVQTSFST